MRWMHPKHARRFDLSGTRGYGPFGTEAEGALHGPLLGVVLHVNDAPNPGTSAEFYAAGPPVNPDTVCPNAQVYGPGHVMGQPSDGLIYQLLPLDWMPWCQMGGNYQYAAIETGGRPGEPLTDAMLDGCARIMANYHYHYGVPLQLANRPGERGLGTHEMGGAAWGGHPCPGPIRAGQRPEILDGAEAYVTRWRRRDAQR